jgi:hypothetical protein
MKEENMSYYAVGGDGRVYTTGRQQRINRQLAMIVRYYTLKS